MAASGAGGSRGGAVRAGRAFVELAADDTPLKDALGRAKRMVLGFAAGLAGAGGVLVGVGGAILGPIAESFREVIKHFDEFSKASDRTGATTEALSALAYAAEQSDASLGDVTSGLKFLQLNLAAAKTGSKEAQASLARFGLTAADFEGKDAAEQMTMIAEALDGIADQDQKTAALRGLLGRGALALAPMFKGGAAGLRELLGEAKDVGAVIGGEDAKNATRIGDSVNKAWTAVKNTFRAVGAALLPQVDTIEQWSNTLVAAVKYVREFINDNRQLVLGVAAVAAGLIAAGGALLLLAGGITAASFVVGALGTAVSAVGAVLAFVFSPVGLGIAAIGVALVALTALAMELGVLEDVADTFAPVWRGLVDTFNTTFRGIKDALAAGDLKLAWQVGVAGLDVIWKGFLVGLQASWNEFKNIIVDGWHAVILALTKAWIDFDAAVRATADMAAAEVAENLGKAERAAELREDARQRVRGAELDKQKADIDFRREQAERDKARADDLMGAVRALQDAKDALAASAQEAATAAENAAWMKFLGQRLPRPAAAAAAAATVELAGVRGQFGGQGLASAIGVGDASIPKKQLEEQQKTNEHLEEIEKKVGGLAVE
jgi:hypothetical protein